MSLGFLTACIAPANRPMPLAESGPVAISFAGAGFLVDLQPAARGAEMTVSADAGAMANDQGLLAKRVAEQFCKGRGGRVDPRALARFQTGSWVFDGGCA
jgi:hypothetical protein